MRTDDQGDRREQPALEYSRVDSHPQPKAPTSRRTPRAPHYIQQRNVIVKLKTKLARSMTVVQFENGYWYAKELKEFAEAIGIPSAGKLRKDELEKAILLFLRTGKIQLPTKRSLVRTGIRDSERGLSLQLPVVNYTNDKQTKEFIEQEARKLVPGLRRRSGARYRLNRWREQQLVNGFSITYRDLIAEYVRLSQTTEPFAHIPHGRYINFVADFLAAEPTATRAKAVTAWKQLKSIDLPKTYRAWASVRISKPVNKKK